MNLKKEYLKCLQKFRQFRKTLVLEAEQKRGKLYFSWLKEKTERIINEKDESCIYKKVLKDTLPKYVITQYTYNKSNKMLKDIINSNYIQSNGKYIFNNKNISLSDIKMLMKYILFKRGNVVWIDFGFNIGNEFGGMHPAVILKNFDTDLFVVPISSKKPPEYVKLEEELAGNELSKEEYENKKEEITEIVELMKINGYRKMQRWARITRMKKVSMLRVNFSGTIGTLEGKDMNIIAEKISLELGNKPTMKNNA